MITGIDHLVLTVEDVAATCEFYSEHFDAEVLTFDGGRKGLGFGDQKINLHPAGDEYDPRSAEPTPGSGDFCLLTEESIDDVEDRLSGAGLEIVEGPVEKVGALGPMTSVYVRDPDGNLVEVAEYDDGSAE